MTLRTTQAGLDLISEFEGTGPKLPGDRFKAYKCPAGVWTIYKGITTASGLIRVTPDLIVTREEGEALFRRGVDKFEDDVERLLGAKACRAINSNQFDALVSFTWNVGVSAFGKSTLLKLIKAGKYEAASREFMKWNKSDGRVMSGLTRRRVAEAALFNEEIEARHVAGLMADVEMPQEVDEPRAPKSMAKSSIGNGALATGALGALGTGKEIADQVSAAASSGADLWTTVKDLSPWVLVVVLIAIIAGYLWVERRRILKVEGV